MTKSNQPKRKQLLAVIYARTSKKNQDTGRQIADLTAVAKAERYKVVKVIEEKISGSAKNEKRKGISELIDYTTTNKVDVVLTAEVSRLGRSPFETNRIVEALTNNSIPIYFHSYRIMTLVKDTNGNYKRNPLAMVLFGILNEFAFMEREVLLERIHSGLAEAKRKGKILGRKIGSTTPNEKLLLQYSKVVKDIHCGYSLRKIMKIHDVSKGTIIKLKRILPPK